MVAPSLLVRAVANWSQEKVCRSRLPVSQAASRRGVRRSLEAGFAANGSWQGISGRDSQLAFYLSCRPSRPTGSRASSCAYAAQDSRGQVPESS